jgi:NADH-quinone oxidoreductase subunit H
MKFGMFYFAEYAEIVTGSMLLVTIFLGGWALPFLHRDGITVEFGTSQLVHWSMAHVWVIVIGVLAFFTKVLAVCWVQCFVRWTLPRFRYDQLMRLGWKILLPASLGNVMLTGVVVLGLAQLGPQVSDALKVAADGTQALVAVVILYLLAKLVGGMTSAAKHQRAIVGTSAARAEKLGGTQSTPMQA